MDLFKNKLVAGVGIAFAASMLAPIIAPVAGRIGRPMAKSLVRGGMMLYEKGREAIAVASESLEDIMAEIRAEASAAPAAGTAPASAAAAATPSPSADPPSDNDLAAKPAAGKIDRPYGGNGASPIRAASKDPAHAATP